MRGKLKDLFLKIVICRLTSESRYAKYREFILGQKSYDVTKEVFPVTTTSDLKCNKIRFYLFNQTNVLEHCV